MITDEFELQGSFTYYVITEERGSRGILGECLSSIMGGGGLTNDYTGEDIVQNGQKGDDLICE